MIENQPKLTGLRIPEQPKQELASPDQMSNHQIDITELPDNKKSILGKSDNLSISNIISSGVAGGIAAVKTGQNVGIIGETMRMPHVQNAMNEMQTRMQNRSNYYDYDAYGGGNNYNNYNNNYNNYDNNYGGTEFSRRRYGSRAEFFGENEYGNSRRSPEMNMAMRNIASGTIEGAKYGVIIGGAVSSVVNAYNVITGKSSGSEAVGTVAADTVTAGLSGATGALSGGLASLGLGIIGIGGVPGLVLAGGVGIAGAVAGQYLLQKSGLYDSIKEKVKTMVSGNKNTQSV